MLILESSRIGPWKTVDAATVLCEMHAKVAGLEFDNDVVREVVQTYVSRHRIVSGFGTPFRQRDERLSAFRLCMRRRERDRLPYWRTMEAVADAVRMMRHVEANIGLGMAAALLDMNLTIEEVGPICTVLAQHMFFANAVEGANQSSTLLRALPEDQISYVGVPPRTSARASAGQSILRLKQPRTGKAQEVAGNRKSPKS
jgi:hypothetical protein